MLAEKRQQKLAETTALPEDITAEVKKAVAEVKPVSVNLQGAIDFDIFLKLQSIVTKYGTRLSKDGNEKHTAERRELLKAKKFTEYQSNIQAFSASQRQIFINLTRVVMAEAEIQQHTFAASGQLYGQNPETRAKLEQVQIEVQKEERPQGETAKDLSKEDTLKYMHEMEEKKVQSITKL